MRREKQSARRSTTYLLELSVLCSLLEMTGAQHFSQFHVNRPSQLQPVLPHDCAVLVHPRTPSPNLNPFATPSLYLPIARRHPHSLRISP